MNETPQPPPLEASPFTTPPVPGPQAQSTVVGYCRACGRALDAGTVRAAHGAIYCPEHVPLDEAAAAASPYIASPYNGTPPPAPNPDVSPKLAFVLGLMPGVGAIYNSQYIKGMVHVLIVGLLFALVGNPPSGLEVLSGLLVAGFWWYMAFEAYHTASKRRLGQKVDEFSSVFPTKHSGFTTPAALIALGIIFLLNNLGFVHLRDVLRFWPMLLIALGVYMLYGRLTARKEQGQ